MPNTPVWALPYPTYTSPGDGPDAFLDLCNRLEALLSSIDTRLDKLEIATISTSGVTAASGFQVISERLAKIGSLVSVNTKIRRTGSTIVSDGDGNITNISMFTMPSGYRPVSGNTGSLRTGGLGPIANGVVNPDGTCQLTATVPNDRWSTGEDWGWVGAWITV